MEKNELIINTVKEIMIARIEKGVGAGAIEALGNDFNTLSKKIEEALKSIQD